MQTCNIICFSSLENFHAYSNNYILIVFYYYVTGLTRLKRILRCEAGITNEWYDIGLGLLDSNIVALDEIMAKYLSDVNKCCTEMFKKWLQHNPEANWDQLISVLSVVGLNTAAEYIKSKFT